MQNLTEGSIFKVLMKLSLPIMASAFLATAYSITDLEKATHTFHQHLHLQQR